MMPRAHVRHARNRGAALILALGVVALLTFVALAFATLTRTELRASQNYRDGERARYLAWSGVERAKYEIRRAVQTPGYPLPWLTYDTFDYLEYSKDQSKGPASGPSTPMPAFEALEPGDSRTATQRPSFGMVMIPTPQALTPLAGSTSKLPWPSGVMGGTYYRDPVTPTSGIRFAGDYYTLKVTDCSSQIYVNDQSAHLQKMLDALGNQPTVLVANLGQKVIDARKSAKGFLRRLDELRGFLTDAEYEKVEPFLTCHSVIDHKVIDNAGPAKLLPLPRAPININLAPREVLAAAFHDIQYKNRAGTPKTVPQGTITTLITKIIEYRKDPKIDVGAVGNKYVLGTNPPVRRYGFTTWPEFAQFLSQHSGVTDPEQQAAILANANPNTDLNKFVPDLSIYHPVDKTDLTVASTEFCFAPCGIFTIDALGIVLGPDGNPVAQAKVRSVVRAWERYVETTQADFEADRIDPPGTARQGLRDITSLPEYRNSSDAAINPAQTLAQQEANTGLHAATWDGQLTFNVITRIRVSSKGMYEGFIEHSLKGKGAQSGNQLNVSGGVRTPAGATGTFIMNPNDTNFAGRWDNGDDLHPLGALIGRPFAAGANGGRHIAFTQGPDPGSINDASKHYEVPPVTLSMPVVQTIVFVGGGLAGVVRFNLTSNIPDYGYDCIENQGFELWFKPSVDAALENRNSMALLDWHSGPPDFVGSLATETLRNGLATADSTTFNTGFFTGVLNSFANNDLSVTNAATYGVQAHCGIWLNRDPSTNTFTVHAKMRLTKPVIFPKNNPQNLPFTMQWNYSSPAIQAGTWHHVLLTFAQPPKSRVFMGPHASFWVDGNEQASITGNPAWPTEISGTGQQISRTIDNFKIRIRAVIDAEIQAGVSGGLLLEGGLSYNINFNAEDYRVPCVVLVDDDEKLVYIGAKDPAGCYAEMNGTVRFVGLVDNFVLHNDWVRKIDKTVEFPNEAYLRRYDGWRPTLGSETADDVNTVVAFRKHTPALEWNRPIRIIAYEVTAWRNEPSVSDDKALVELGRVFLRFGWKGPTSSVPALDSGYSGTEPAGWTAPLNGGPSPKPGELPSRPFNALANGYTLPDRDNKFSNGFLTNPSGEQYNYALEIRPVLDVQTGPRMAPVIDDVTVTYMPWDACLVINEEEVID